ncbi:MAG: hypothetical protein IKO72_10655 [Kiritimatiellae bacterium]|nr:hypothetical protein [Kiritimatiellia bacterium]
MPQPININNVPMNYFLHGIDAAREAQNAQAPGGVGGQPADNGIAGEVQAHQPGPAAKMVQQLDVLLVKAAKASTQSLDGKAIKNSLLKLVTDGALDKDSLKLLGKTADTAAKTLKALDKFTGAQLAAAVKSGSGERGSFAEIDLTTNAGKAVKAAVDAQNTLSDMLAQLDRQLDTLERHDDEMRAANPDYWGVDRELHNEVVELRQLCDRRAAEIDALAFQMHDFAVYQASRGNNADPNIAAILKAKVNDLLPRQALAMHGTADGLATVSQEISGRLRPLAEKIDAFKQNPNASLAGDNYLALQSDIRTMKAAVADIREHGIQVGGGRMMVANDILKALETEVAQAEELFKTAQRDVKQRMLDNFINTADKLFRMTDQDEGQLQRDEGEHADTLFNARDLFLASLAVVKNAVLAENPDQNAINEALNGSAAVADQLLNATYNITVPLGSRSEGVTKFIGTAQAAHTVVAKLVTMAHYILNSDRLFTGNEAMSVFKGELSVSSVVESRARGLRTDDVDPANEDANIESSKLLGAGNVGTVYLLRRRDGAEVVFKGEMESRTGLNTACVGKGDSYKKSQQIVNLNIATKNAANALGCGNLIVNYKAGTHEGTFGFFMDKAKGRCAKDLAGKGGSKTAEAGLTGKEISNLEAGERRRVKGEIMRQLNRLQWLDIITGQLDRHNDNYFIHVDRQTHNVTVSGIDNDACYSKYRTGVGTFALDKSRGGQFYKELVNVLRNAGVRNPDNEAKRLLQEDPSITRQGKNITVNALRVRNKAILSALAETTGVKSIAVPDKIDRDFYNHLMELKNNPAARSAYLDSLRPRMGMENLAAAEARLKDVIDHAERLAEEHKIVEVDKWGSETTPPRNSSYVQIELPDGRHKSLNRQSSFDVNNMTCPSYFARDGLDKLFPAE